ncbi:hypothetical protein [Streptomyces sp. NPDC054784]
MSSAARRMDAAAGWLYRAGMRLGGERGGRVGDAVANLLIAPLRRRANDD